MLTNASMLPATHSVKLALCVLKEPRRANDGSYVP